MWPMRAPPARDVVVNVIEWKGARKCDKRASTVFVAFQRVENEGATAQTYSTHTKEVKKT